MLPILFRFRSYRIRIAGDGPALASLRDRYCEKVDFLGWMNYDDVVKETARADVCVVPSICEEACGTAILEALGLGWQVLALALGGTPELVRYGAGSQLRMFDKIQNLVIALSSPADFNRKWPRQHTADVMSKLPEIIGTYTQIGGC